MKTIKKRDKLISLFAIFLLITAGWLIFFAAYFHPEEFSIPEKEFQRSRGFVFQTTEMIDYNQSEFKIAFSEIDCENGTLSCEIIITPLLNKSSEYNSAFFLLQIPFEASNIEVQYPLREPEFFGGYTLENKSDNLTYVMFSVPKGNVTYNSRVKSINYNFTINSAFNRLNGYTYEIPITFEGGLNNASNEFQYLKDYRFYYTLYLFKTQRSFLHFEMNNRYQFSNFQPTFDDVKPWRNYDAYYWDLKKTSAKGSEHSIIVELTNLTDKSKIEK